MKHVKEILKMWFSFVAFVVAVIGTIALIALPTILGALTEGALWFVVGIGCSILLFGLALSIANYFEEDF